MWIRIFNSDIRALRSFDVAPAAKTDNFSKYHYTGFFNLDGSLENLPKNIFLKRETDNLHGINNENKVLVYISIYITFLTIFPTILTIIIV